MSAAALIRFWALVLAAYVFLEEQRALLEQEWQRPVSIGQAQQEVQRVHRFHIPGEATIANDSLLELRLSEAHPYAAAMVTCLNRLWQKSHL